MFSLQRTFQNIQPKFYLQLPVFKYSCNSRGSSSVFDSGSPHPGFHPSSGSPQNGRDFNPSPLFPFLWTLVSFFALLFTLFFHLA